MRRRLALVTALLACTYAGTPESAQVIAIARPGVAFSAILGGTNPPPQTVAITNRATPALTWRITSAVPPWLSVTPTNGSAPATLTFSVNIAGLRPGRYCTKVVVDSNDTATPKKEIDVCLTIVSVAPGHAAYKVELSMEGYTGLAEGYPNCKVQTDGYDWLVGIVMGVENVGPAEDVDYEGDLIRITDIDVCETKGRRSPRDDERVWCAATLGGVAAMKVTISVQGEEGRGAFVNTRVLEGLSSHVIGDCDAADQAVWQNEFPDGGSGGSPDGAQIDEATTGTARLFMAGRARLVVGTFPPLDKKRTAWTLKVIEKLK